MLAELKYLAREKSSVRLWQEVTLWTDHKPLEMIAKKPLATAPKRLQCLMSRLMQYDVEIKYKRGPELYLSDTLSRAYLLLEHLPWKADQEVERIHSVKSVKKLPKILSYSLWSSDSEWMDQPKRKTTYWAAPIFHRERWVGCSRMCFFQRSKKRHPDESETQD